MCRVTSSITNWSCVRLSGDSPLGSFNGNTHFAAFTFLFPSSSEGNPEAAKAAATQATAERYAFIAATTVKGRERPSGAAQRARQNRDRAGVLLCRLVDPARRDKGA